MAPRPKPRASSSRALWIGVAAFALVAGYLLYRRRTASSSGSFDSSGTPGPNQAPAAAADQGAGGATGSADPSRQPTVIAGQQTDEQPAQQQQVDTTPQGSSDLSSSTVAASATAPGVVGYDVPVPTLAPYAPVTQGVSATHGLDYSYTPGVQSHPGADAAAAGGYVPANYAVLNTPVGSNARRPGFQL